MVITLNGADFSANNIGQITLPYISDIATEMCTHLLNGVYSQERFWSFGRFIDNLESNGILELINWISVPSLAKSIEDSYTNLLNGVVATNADAVEFVIKNKYGVYALYDANKQTTQAYVQLYNANPSQACIACGTIQKDDNQVFMLVTPDLRCSTRFVTAGYPAINLNFTNSNIVKGVNCVIAGTTDNKLYRNKIFCKWNGTDSILNTTAPIIEGSLLELRYLNFSGDYNFANHATHNNGIETMHLSFTRVLSDAECAILTNALNAYQTSFYEADIDSVI